MVRWGRALVLSVGLFVLGASSVRAQESAPMSEARALFMAGRVAFDEGRYEAALKYFESSYEQSQRPLLLYNIAQCYDRMRRDEQAIAAFERYLAVETDPEMRGQVEARLRALKEAVAARPAPPASAPVLVPPALAPTPAVVEEPKRARWFLRAPAITTASGVAVALAGAILMGVGSAHGSDVEHARVGSHYHALQSDLDSANHQWIAGQVLVGIGAATAVGGAVWWLLGARKEHLEGPVQVSFSPTSIRLDGRF